MQDTRASDGRTNALRYLAKRVVTDVPPQAVLSTEVPHVMSAELKVSLMVGRPACHTSLSLYTPYLMCEAST